MNLVLNDGSWSLVISIKDKTIVIIAAKAGARLEQVPTPLPASQPTPNSEQDHSRLLCSLPAHIQVGRAQEFTPQQNSSKKITTFPHSKCLGEAKSQCKLFKSVSIHSLEHHHYNSHLNVPMVTWERFLHQTSSVRVLTVQILGSLLLLSATHLKSEGYWGCSQQLTEAWQISEILQSNRVGLLARSYRVASKSLLPSWLFFPHFLTLKLGSAPHFKLNHYLFPFTPDMTFHQSPTN